MLEPGAVVPEELPEPVLEEPGALLLEPPLPGEVVVLLGPVVLEPGAVFVPEEPPEPVLEPGEVLSVLPLGEVVVLPGLVLLEPPLLEPGDVVLEEPGEVVLEEPGEVLEPLPLEPELLPEPELPLL